MRLDAIVLRALENTPERRYQTIGEMRTQVMTVVNKLGPTCYVSTPEQLATFDGQRFEVLRRWLIPSEDDGAIAAEAAR